MKKPLGGSFFFVTTSCTPFFFTQRRVHLTGCPATLRTHREALIKAGHSPGTRSLIKANKHEEEKKHFTMDSFNPFFVKKFNLLALFLFSHPFKISSCLRSPYSLTVGALIWYFFTASTPRSVLDFGGSGNFNFGSSYSLINVFGAAVAVFAFVRCFSIKQFIYPRIIFYGFI